MTGAICRACVLVALAACAARPAAADLPPLDSRDWSLDLYDGAVIGSARIVGMGGVQSALAEGSAGALSNPAGAAARPATSNDAWDWDFHLDALSAVVASDFDNNGLTDDDRDDRRTSFGVAVMYRRWGFAVVGGAAAVGLPTADTTVTASTSVGKLAVAYQLDDDWTVGGAVRVGRLDLDSDAPLFALVGSGLEAGALYRPHARSLRVGASVALPIAGTEVETADCDPASCHGYVLPERVEVPYQVGAGVAWRFARTPWNQQVPARFRDERALIVGADLVLSGPVADGMGLEGFARHLAQPSGRAPSLSIRAGAEYEAVPGWLRARAGSYWEPGRFDGPGRLHGTAGVEATVYRFCLWSRSYRLRLSATGDFAPRFANAGIGVGFWH